MATRAGSCLPAAILAIGLGFAAVAPLGAADLPPWLAGVLGGGSVASLSPSSTPSPGASAAADTGLDASAEVLLDELRWAVADNGDIESRHRYAVRIHSPAGRSHALARVGYASDSEKLRELQAWVVPPRGAARRLGKGETIDLAASPEDVYSEQRVRVLDASDDVEPGAVFAFEAIVARRSFFNQLHWPLQSSPLAVRLARVELALPPGWHAEAHLFNRAALPPSPAGTSLAWELRDLPAVRREPSAPPLSSLVPRLAVNYTAGADRRLEPRSFGRWDDVARWAGEIADPRARPDASIEARAKELTAGRTGTRERVAAIARFVQQLPYISIQVGLGRFQPHAAADVLAKRYGDCKDKATLMRALLESAGVASLLVLASADDRGYVQGDWPSPAQFDHAIVAIRWPNAPAFPASASHASLGPLVFFDPTDETTALGDLPEDEQGSLALLATAAPDPLVRLPVLPPSSGTLVRETKAELSAAGDLIATVVERSRGQAAARERRTKRAQSEEEYQATIESWLAHGATGVKASRVEAREEQDGGFRLEFDLSAARYGQLMQARLLVFKPVLVAREDALALTAARREHPLALHALSWTDTARVKLPAGFVVDELPPAVTLDAPFGRYALSVEATGGELVVTRALETKAVTVPAAEYAQARAFFEKLVAAEQAPVVLARQGP